MCGIAGFIDLRASSSTQDLSQIATNMAKAMYLRGPDDSGIWCDRDSGIALAQARLSIIDLSPAGHQPMVSQCGRYVITYNGEAYNANDLRSRIKDINWRGHSDTEIVLEACAAWGVDEAVAKLVGMFAFALWDKQKKTLTLVRDRFGIKPIYWGVQDGLLLFGSELKALMAHNGWQREIDRNALSSYLRFNYVPAPLSIFKDIQKLLPAHKLTYCLSGGQVKIEKFWNLRAIASKGLKDPLKCSDEFAEEKLSNLIDDAVSRRMAADVPLGAFLSGGIDSSVVVAAMQAQSSRPIKTYTMGFDIAGYDESKYAAGIAKHLGTDHSELRVTSDHALSAVPKLAQWYDEPFADSSQIPTFLVSELARQSVTVALSGDGGDELFAGYERHRWSEFLWQKTGWIPRPLAKIMARGLRMPPSSFWHGLNAVLPDNKKMSHPAIKARKLADVLALPDSMALYRRLITAWDSPDQMVAGGKEYHGIEWDKTLLDQVPNMMERIQLLDALTYLPDDILTKVDRASMAVSLEARVPLLDHRIAEFAFSLPRRMRYRDGVGKWILRKVLARRVPVEMFERPKMGFGIPLDHWLRGPLRDWAEDLLSFKSLSEEGYLDPVPIRKAWQEHLEGRADWTTNLWTILMFQAWREHWKL